MRFFSESLKSYHGRFDVGMDEAENLLKVQMENSPFSMNSHWKKWRCILKYRLFVGPITPLFWLELWMTFAMGSSNGGVFFFCANLRIKYPHVHSFTSLESSRNATPASRYNMHKYQQGHRNIVRWNWKARALLKGYSPHRGRLSLVSRCLVILTQGS